MIVRLIGSTDKLNFDDVAKDSKENKTQKIWLISDWARDDGEEKGYFALLCSRYKHSFIRSFLLSIQHVVSLRSKTLFTIVKYPKKFYGSFFSTSIDAFLTWVLNSDAFRNIMRSNWTIKSLWKKFPFAFLDIRNGFVFRLCPLMFSPDYPRAVPLLRFRILDRIKLHRNVLKQQRTGEQVYNLMPCLRHVLVKQRNIFLLNFLEIQSADVDMNITLKSFFM